MSGEGDQHEVDIKLSMESANEQFKRINVRLDELQSAFYPIIMNPRKHVVEVEEDEDFSRHEENYLGNIMLQIPAFEGKTDPELYLRWETKIERIFDCQNFSEEMKVKLAVVNFFDYASIWWDSLQVNTRRNCERPILLWEELKAIMRKRFIPNYYYRDLHRNLRELKQGFMSVDEYYQEMETIMFRAHVIEDKELTMARFIDGLNPEIADIVDLQDHEDKVELLHEAIRIEKLLKSRKEGSNNSNYTWKHKGKGRDYKSSKGKIEDNIKCFECLDMGTSLLTVPTTEL